MWCRRKPPWPCILVVVGSGWLVATVCTVLGMYMVICPSYSYYHQQRRFPNDTSYTVQMVLRRDPACRGSWTPTEAQMMLVSGSLCNLVLLVVMLFLLWLDGRLSRPLPPDLPPDYELLMKEETPPPSFSDLQSLSCPSPTPPPPPPPPPYAPHLAA